MSIKATLEVVHGGCHNYTAGKLFQMSTTLLLNTFLQIFNLD